MINYSHPARTPINVRHAARDRRTARRTARRALGAERVRLIAEVAANLGVDTEVQTA
jgi:hypothetical protein